MDAHNSPHDTAAYLHQQPLSEPIDLTSRESMIKWHSDMSGTDVGWTFIYQPDYPEVDMNQGNKLCTLGVA